MKALGAGKRVCALRKIPAWHSWLPVPGTKGGSGRKGPRSSNQGFPVTGPVETVVLIWAKERAARKWKLGFAVAPWLR